MNELVAAFATVTWALLFWGGWYTENISFFLFAGIAQWVGGVYVERIMNEYRSEG